MPKVTDEHRVARREQILAATLRCVAAQGFHKTTIADVIRESGLSAGAVYGYFRSKDELIHAIADRSVGVVESALRDMAEREPVPTPAEAMQSLTSTIVAGAQAGDVDITRVAVAAWAEAVRDESVRTTVAGRIQELRDSYTAVVARQQEAGLIDPEADTAEVTQALLGLIPGFILQRLVMRDVTPESYARGLAAVLRPRS